MTYLYDRVDKKIRKIVLNGDTLGDIAVELRDLVNCPESDILNILIAYHERLYLKYDCIDVIKE